MALPKLMTMDDVVEFTGRSAVTIWHWARTGQFPKPVKLSDQTTRFIEDEILEWFENRPRADYKSSPAAPKKKPPAKLERRYVRSRRVPKRVA